MAQPARRMTAPAPAPQPHAWQRNYWLWDLYFAVIGAITVLSVALEGKGSHPWPPSRLVACLLVVALGVWYVAVARRPLRDGPPGLRRGLVYQVGVFALFVPAVTLNGAVEIALFALVPQAFMVWRLVRAVAVLLALYLAAFAAMLGRAGELPELPQLLSRLGFGVAIMLLLSVVLSVYIGRIAQQSAERAELIDQLATSRAEVSRLSHEAGVAAERQRLAGDIHDTIAQGLSSVVMLLQAADAELDRDPGRARSHLAVAAQTARENLAEARALVAALTPAELDGASLPDALRRVAHRTGPGTTVAVSGQPRPLPTALEVVLLRAVQESLTNVANHASARRTQVSLGYAAGTVALEVADDGCGFASAEGNGGYGLAAMRTRVEQVGGTMAVDTIPGAGTTVRVEVPA